VELEAQMAHNSALRTALEETRQQLHATKAMYKHSARELEAEREELALMAVRVETMVKQQQALEEMREQSFQGMQRPNEDARAVAALAAAKEREFHSALSYQCQAYIASQLQHWHHTPTVVEAAKGGKAFIKYIAKEHNADVVGCVDVAAAQISPTPTSNKAIEFISPPRMPSMAELGCGERTCDVRQIQSLADNEQHPLTRSREELHVVSQAAEATLAELRTSSTTTNRKHDLALHAEYRTKPKFTGKDCSNTTQAPLVLQVA